MRLANHWRRNWTFFDLGVAAGRVGSVRLGEETVEVVRLGKGAPLVLVPGLAGGWRLVFPLAQRLARHFEVITYNLRGDGCPFAGFGGMGRRVWDLGGHADDLASLIEQLQLECPAVLGVSFGGAIALELAIEHPGRVGAVIVQGVDSQYRGSIGFTVVRRVLERFPLPQDNRFLNQFFNLLHGGKPESQAVADFVVERIWETDQSIIAQRLAQIEGFCVSDRLWRLEAPTLVLAGSRDVIVPKARHLALAAAMPEARCEVIEGAGHIAFLTHRHEFVGHVRRHLRRVEASIER